VILQKIHRVSKQAWLLLGAVVVVVTSMISLRLLRTLEAPTIFYYVQPLAWLTLAGVAFFVGKGRRDRLRHKTERMFLIGCVLSLWFVVYFLSGLYFTYVQNTLVVDIKSIAINLLGFGVAGACMEYVRYTTMLLAHRRNAVWFGAIVVIVFGFAQMNIGQVFFVQTLEQFVKLAVADFIPAIVSSMLLTYLALSSGLGSMLLYRLAVVAMTILPPVIPKHDWYVIGVGSVLLSLAVYIAIEQTQRDHERGRHHYGQVRRAYNTMVTATLFALVLFMTGVFSYKPLAIVSNSMVPVYSRGSVVVVQKIDSPMDIKVGDIIQYEATGKTITHRVVEIDAAADGSGKRVFITKGDNVSSQDPLVAESQVRGIIRGQLPYVGYPSIWLKEASQGASK
jgi:signal peptidase